MDISITAHHDGSCPEQTGVGSYRLAAEHAWLVEGDAELVRGVEVALAPFCERVGRALMLRFGNAVGSFDAGPLGRLTVHSGKWDDRHFDAMLSDITSRMAALPFAAGTGAELPYDRSITTEQRVLYHAFVYLRHLCCSTASPEHGLEPAMRLVLAQPHRSFERIAARAPLHAARRVEPNALMGMVTSRAGLTRVSSASQVPLARALLGHLPSEIDETHVRSTLDVPENQFVKAFLTQAVGIVDAMRALPRMQPHFRRRIESDCDAIMTVLAPLVRHAMWREVSAMRRVPVESQVLQRRRGYREILRHFVRLRLTARLPLPATSVVGLLEIKDIAELYEMWAFFEVERSVTMALGCPPIGADAATVDDLGAHLGWGLRITWGRGIELFYNLSYGLRHANRRSYSVALRPDIVLRIPAGPAGGDHVFDAKFKVRRLEDVMASDEHVDAADHVAERRGVFKQADLYKMHTYRDAIAAARTVWILYPGTEVRFFDEVRGQVDRVHELGADATGVGAIALQPGERSEQVASLLARLLGQ